MRSRTRCPFVQKELQKRFGNRIGHAVLNRAKDDGAECVRLFTNTLVSWEFYEKRGFKKVAEKLFQDGSGNQSLVYEYVLKEHEYEKHHL